MGLLYETSILGFSVRVFSDRVEYTTGFGGAVESIPINQIASIKLGNFLLNRIVIETTGGREYEINTGKKKEVAAAIYQAQAGGRYSSSPASVGSVADELTKLVQLRDQGALSPAEFERQKSVVLGGTPGPASMPSGTAAPRTAAPRTAPSATAPKRGSLGRKIKRAALVVVGLCVTMIVIAGIVGPKHKHAGSEPTNTATEPSTIASKDYTVEVTNNPKKRAGDQDFRQCDVIFKKLPDSSEVVNAIVRTALEAEIKKSDTTDVLAMAFLGEDTIGYPRWSGSLIYKASTKRILTLAEDGGRATQRTDLGKYLLEIRDGKTMEGIKPEKKWLDASFVFPSRPTDAEIYKVVTDELHKHRGIEVNVTVYTGDKANGMSWQQIDDQDGNKMHVTVSPTGGIEDGSRFFTSRTKAMH